MTTSASAPRADRADRTDRAVGAAGSGPPPRLSALHVYPVKGVRALSTASAVVEPWGLAGDRRWMLVDGEGRFVSQRERAVLALVEAEPLPGGGVRLTAPGVPGMPAPLTAEPPRGTALRHADVRLWRDKVPAVLDGSRADETAAWFDALFAAEPGGAGSGPRGPFSLVHMADPAVSRPVDPEFGLPGEVVSFADGFPLLLTTTASLAALNELIAEGVRAAEGPLPMDRFRPNAVVDGTAPWAEDGWRRVRIGEVVFRVAKPCGRCVVTTTDQFTARRGKEPLRTLGRHRAVGGKLIFGQNLVPESTGTLRVSDTLTVME
jgi:uncharacterized protein YcbX